MYFIKKRATILSKKWLAINDNFIDSKKTYHDILEEISFRFKRIEVWFSDLDDFDTISPAKKIALRAIGTSHFNPGYICWAFITLLQLTFFEKKCIENERWKKYYNMFLKKDVNQDWLQDKAFEKINQLISNEYIKELLYPGVLDFYHAFDARKIMVTRNIERIAYRYTKVLPFEKYYHEVHDKGKVVENFIKNNPEIKYYGSGGDSVEDEVAVDVLKYYAKKGIIAEPVCLFRADSPRKVNHKFDIFTGKDRTVLAEILK